MRLQKVYRLWLSSMLAAVLVCLQLATSAYACPLEGTSGMAVANAMSGMTDCDQMANGVDKKQPQLCKAHCEQGSRTVNLSSPLDFTPVPMLDWLSSRLSVWLPLSGLDTIISLRTANTGPPVGATPVYLTFLVLRN